MKLPQLYDIFRERWERFQTAHIISDTHFGDKDLQANIKDRPNDEDYIKQIKESEENIIMPKVNIVVTTYYKGTALESVNKKLEEYLDNADKNENDINEI